MGWEFGTVETSGIDELAGMVEEGVELDVFGIAVEEAEACRIELDSGQDC